MPPKKSQIKETKTQKSLQKCNFNNRGYCKSKKECINKHSDVVCDNSECDEENCSKRHPYQCKYGTYCRFNKKKECLYSHVTLASDDGELEALNKVCKNRVRELEDSIASLQNELIGKNSIINVLDKKMNELEEVLSSFKKDVKDKNAKLSGLELKLDELEKKQKNDKQLKDKKIKDLENAIKQKFLQEQSDDFKCSECDFVAKTKTGLKTHKVRIHTKTNKLQYPVECELCYAKLENEIHMKEHLKFHSYKKSTFKCEDCDHCSENFLAMEWRYMWENITVENLNVAFATTKQKILKH